MYEGSVKTQKDTHKKKKQKTSLSLCHFVIRPLWSNCSRSRALSQCIQGTAPLTQAHTHKHTHSDTLRLVLPVEVSPASFFSGLAKRVLRRQCVEALRYPYVPPCGFEDAYFFYTTRISMMALCFE